MDERDTYCPRKCCWTPYGCGRRYECEHHQRAVERATTTRRERAIRASLRGLNDPEWTGEG